MKECALYTVENSAEKSVRCSACAHRCLINDNGRGVCGVRQNKDGKLFLLVYGMPVSVHADPIEKKPLYHFMPGTLTYSFGTIGCNFRCAFCQNYDISQAKRIAGKEMSPEEIVLNALKLGCKSISYTYNEPTIFIEFVKDVAVLARAKGLKNILVTNGYMTVECFEFIHKYIDAMNIDLKGDEAYYKKLCGASLKPVQETIKRAYLAGIHIEITTLVVPGENDRIEQLERIAKFIASLDKGKGNIPWHISRFFPMYKLENKNPTDVRILREAEKMGKNYLKNVHVGNV
jgi:pyruvate formate lyase activating enzyme